jgi:hypothetical protein
MKTAITSFFLVCLLLGIASCTTPSMTTPVSQTPQSTSQPPKPIIPTPSQPHPPTILELYYTGDTMFSDKYITLNTVYSKTGTGSFRDYITINQSPWVINWDYIQTSNIGQEFYFDIWPVGSEKPRLSEIMPTSGFGYEDTNRQSPLYGVENLIFDNAGTFNIDIFASGCNWWIKIGVEPKISTTALSQQLIGKWQYECPANITLPTCRQQDHQLEFSTNGQVTFLKAGFSPGPSLNDGRYTSRYSSRYSLINNKLEIYWIEDYESYIVKISNDKLTLTNQQEIKTYHRIQ